MEIRNLEVLSLCEGLLRPWQQEDGAHGYGVQSEGQGHVYTDALVSTGG